MKRPDSVESKRPDSVESKHLDSREPQEKNTASAAGTAAPADGAGSAGGPHAPAETPPCTVRPRVSRRLCLILMAIATPILLWLEVGRPTMSEDPVLQPLMGMAVSRLVGTVVFAALLLYEGYRVWNPLRKPFWRSILWCLPPILVVINNMPWIALCTGQAYIVHGAPVYWFWLALESLAIGLFEEFAFRGVILLIFAEKRRRTHKGLFWSIILTSAVFGGVHLVNLFLGAGIGPVLMQIGYSFLIGAMCSLVLFKTANIWICVFLHAVFDFGGHLISSIGGGQLWDTPTVIITAVLAVLTVIYMVWQFLRMDPHETDRIYENP